MVFSNGQAKNAFQSDNNRARKQACRISPLLYRRGSMKLEFYLSGEACALSTYVSNLHSCGLVVRHLCVH